MYLIKSFKIFFCEYLMLQRGYQQSIDKRGLDIYKIIFYLFSGCGLYSGALSSPEITVVVQLWADPQK